MLSANTLISLWRTHVRQNQREFGFYAGLAVLAALLWRYQLEVQLLMVSGPRREQFWDNITTNAADMLTLTLSIVVEALPFIVLGVLISTLIQTYIPTEAIIKRLPKNPFARRGIVSCLGMLMPVCECGNVPVARSLMAKGFSPAEATTFLLSAPSVNIITIIVTLEAFGFNRSVAIVRVLATIVIANIAALLISRFINRDRMLTDDFKATCDARAHGRPTLDRATNLFRSEMWLITRLLIIGALIAAASQTFVPREVIASIGSNVFLAVAAMLALAFVVSICSSVDAFFALAYVNTFSLGSILAFLVAGPMVDIKMLALLKTTFTVRALALMSAIVLSLSLALGLGFSYVW